MDSTSQVILILKLILNIAPPALYFVILGLVNSQSRPHLISSRNDWLGLVCVFFPVVIYPSIVLASWGYYIPAVLIIIAIGIGLLISLPKPDSGWVIYNISTTSARQLILRTLEKYDIRYEIGREKDIIKLPEENSVIKISGFPLLRNVTIYFDADANESNAQIQKNRQTQISRILDEELGTRVAFIESGINVIGPAMLLAGSTMFILPLMMMIRHIDAFVRVFSDLLPV